MNGKTPMTTTGFRLPRERPSAFNPVEIVYTRYAIDRTRPPGRQVVSRPGGCVIRGMSVDDFIASRVKKDPLPTCATTYGQLAEAASRPIDIYVSDECWLVIELDEQEKWQFTPGQPAITTRDDHKDDNWGLTHVMPKGPSAGGDGPSGPGCRIIYFGVHARCGHERQRFICNVDFSQIGFLDEQIDPDIPNDGGKFPFPLIGKPCPEDE